MIFNQISSLVCFLLSAPKSALSIPTGRQHPASFAFKKQKAKLWLNRKRPPDKRYALRNYFQLTIKTRGHIK